MSNKKTKTKRPNFFLQYLKKAKEVAKGMNNSVIVQKIKVQTEKAMLLSLFDLENKVDFEMWAPKSLVTNQKALKTGAVEMTFVEWFFNKNVSKFLRTVKVKF